MFRPGTFSIRNLRIYIRKFRTHIRKFRIYIRKFRIEKLSRRNRKYSPVFEQIMLEINRFSFGIALTFPYL